MPDFNSFVVTYKDSTDSNIQGHKVAVSNCFYWLHGLVNSFQLPESKPADRDVEKMIFWKEMVICSVLLFHCWLWEKEKTKKPVFKSLFFGGTTETVLYWKGCSMLENVIHIK